MFSIYHLTQLLHFSAICCGIVVVSPFLLLPAGHSSKVHYLSETHFCQEAVVRYLSLRRVQFVLKIYLLFVILNDF